MDLADIEVSTLGQIGIVIGAAAIGAIVNKLYEIYKTNKDRSDDTALNNRIQHITDAFRLYYAPIQHLLARDLVLWRWKLSIDKYKNYKTKIRLDAKMLSGHLNILDIHNENPHLAILGDSDDYQYYIEFMKYCKHVELYDDMRLTGDYKSYPKDKDAPFPVEFVKLIESRCNKLRHDYIKLLGIKKNKQRRKRYCFCTKNTSDDSDDSYGLDTFTSHQTDVENPDSYANLMNSELHGNSTMYTNPSAVVIPQVSAIHPSSTNQSTNQVNQTSHTNNNSSDSDDRSESIECDEEVESIYNTVLENSGLNEHSDDSLESRRRSSSLTTSGRKNSKKARGSRRAKRSIKKSRSRSTTRSKQELPDLSNSGNIDSSDELDTDSPNYSHGDNQYRTDASINVSKAFRAISPNNSGLISVKDNPNLLYNPNTNEYIALPPVYYRGNSPYYGPLPDSEYAEIEEFSKTLETYRNNQMNGRNTMGSMNTHNTLNTLNNTNYSTEHLVIRTPRKK